MRLSEALSAFPGRDAPLDYLAAQFSAVELDELTPALVREFLARWYVEEASSRRLSARAASPSPSDRHESQPFPRPQVFIDSLRVFFNWAEPFSDPATHRERLQLLDSLTDALPRAIEIAVALSIAIKSRGGAISFPEFLTSFEAGGHSEYDIGGPAREAGEVSAREGYFRIVDVDGDRITAEDMLLEERVAPLLFPEAVTPLLDKGYILNLEIVRQDTGWQIINCGFVYPPDTEL